MTSDPTNIPIDAVERVASDGPSAVAPSVRKRWMAVVVVSVLLLFGASAFWWQSSIRQNLEKAKQAVARGSWEIAIDRLDNHLRYKPEDAEAHLLIAESLVMSAGRSPAGKLEKAVSHLQQIPDTSPLAAKARLQEGRILLFLMKKPAAAERLLKESLRLDPDSLETSLLMWQLLDVTGRHIISDVYFWRAHELSSPSQRGLLLRDWFLSEFYPEQLHAALYSQMGVSAVGQIPASVNLMVHFREAEPEASFLHAGLAKYYHDVGNLAGAMDLLKECPDVPSAMKDPFFVSVLFETLIDLGEFQKAKASFQEFPTPHEGYLYWRSEGMYHDYVQNNSEAAVVSIRKAMETAPAKFDWGLMTRLSVCLKKVGAVKDAEEMQARVDHLTRDVLTVEQTSLLRNLFIEPMRPDDAARFVDFYGKFGLEQEVSAWSDYKTSLMETQSALVP